MSNNHKKTIYTDGSCTPNTGAGHGGYAAIILAEDGNEIVIKGHEADTTNNKMEMMAVIKALQAIDEPCELEIYSDSEYVVKAFTEGRLEKWIANGWKKSDRKPALNRELWEQMLTEIDRVSIGKPTFKWVKAAHDAKVNKNPYNNRCDKLAREEADKLLPITETAEDCVEQDWVEDAADMSYEELAQEWGFDDSDGEAQEPD